jgi:predicted O-methyltransferase YrrM
MDVDRFLRELPALFERFPTSPTPLDRSLAPVLERVDGLAAENNLALLRLAGSLLGPGEVYAEIGSLHGRSLVAALERTDARFVALDNFSFDGSSRERLEGTLAEFGLAGRGSVVEGDAQRSLDAGALGSDPVGVLYYDGDHSTEATLAALRRAPPHLAQRALLIVDDSDWERVAKASSAYVAEEPRATLALAIDGRARDQPWWWDGMHLITWDGRT